MQALAEQAVDVDNARPHKFVAAEESVVIALQ